LLERSETTGLCDVSIDCPCIALHTTDHTACCSYEEPVLQDSSVYNALLHTEPIESIAYGLYWSAFFLLVTPLAVIFLLIQLFVNLGLWFSGKNNVRAYHPREVPDIELAVVVTGCDTGFGKEIAAVAAKEGFVVFAGCLKAESLKQFNDITRIHPFLLDVTSDKSAARAVKEFEVWLHEDDEDALKHHASVLDDGYASESRTEASPPRLIITQNRY
jgi:hypothetical protein